MAKARVKTKILMQSGTPQKPIFESRSVYPVSFFCNEKLEREV